MDNADDNMDVLNKADEFLKRRRAQLTSAVIDRTEPAPVAMPAPIVAPTSAIDDLPVLTDVVDDTSVIQALELDIAQELDKWLDEHLAQAVAHAMDGITDKLIVQIQQSAEKELLPRLQRSLIGRDEHNED